MVDLQPLPPTDLRLRTNKANRLFRSARGKERPVDLEGGILPHVDHDARRNRQRAILAHAPLAIDKVGQADIRPAHLTADRAILHKAVAAIAGDSEIGQRHVARFIATGDGIAGVVADRAVGDGYGKGLLGRTAVVEDAVVAAVADRAVGDRDIGIPDTQVGVVVVGAA